MDFKDYIAKHNIDLSTPDPVLDLAHLVMAARYEAKCTQQELAERMGTRQPSIARVEKGDVEPSIAFLRRVADALGATLVLPSFDFGTAPSQSVTVFPVSKDKSIRLTCRMSGASKNNYSTLNLYAY